MVNLNPSLLAQRTDETELRDFSDFERAIARLAQGVSAQRGRLDAELAMPSFAEL